MLPSNMACNPTSSFRRRKSKQKRLLIIPASLLLIFLFSSSSLATPANLISKINDHQSTSTAASSNHASLNPQLSATSTSTAKQGGLEWSRLFSTNAVGQDGHGQGSKSNNLLSSSPSDQLDSESHLFHFPSLDRSSRFGDELESDSRSLSSADQQPSVHHTTIFHHRIHQISKLPQRLHLHLLSPSRVYKSILKAMDASKGVVSKAGSAAQQHWPAKPSTFTSSSSSPLLLNKSSTPSIHSNSKVKPWQSYGALYASLKTLLIQAYESDPEHPFSRPIVAAILSFLIFVTLKTFELGPCKPTAHQLQMRALLAHRKSLNGGRGRSPMKKPLGRSPSQKRRSEKEEPSLLPSSGNGHSYAEMSQNAESLNHCLAARLCRARARSEAKRQKEQEKAEEAMRELAWAEQQQLLQQEKALLDQQQGSQEEGKLNLEPPKFVRLPSWTDRGPVPLTIIVEEPEPASRPPSRPCSRASISNSAPHRRASISPSPSNTISYPARTLSMSPPPSPLTQFSPANSHGLPAAHGREADGTRSPSPANVPAASSGSQGQKGQNLMDEFRNLRMRIAEGLRREYEDEGLGRRQGSV